LTDFDDLDAIARLDSGDVLSTIEAMSDQIGNAWEIGRNVSGLPDGLGVESVVVLGMGGSGAAGDLVGALVQPRLPIPFMVVRSYGFLPEWIGRNSLVFALSYSGNTEETLAAFDETHERGARIVAVSAGGELAKRSAEAGCAHVTLPSGMQPRAASAFTSVPLLSVLVQMGLIPDVAADVEEAISVVGDLQHRCHRKTPVVENPAKDLAARVAGKVPLIYGGRGIGAAIARRFKTDLNEYAKSPAFWNEIPEMNHNEIEGWRNAAGIAADFVAVWFADAGEDERITLRWELTRRIIADAGGDIVEVPSEGTSPIARLMSFLYVTQLAAFYVGLAHDVDPGPVAVIEEFKRAMAAREDTI
jgi:glucose/mannose-6-phosphate isomerase